MFVENGYDKSKLEAIAKNYIQKRDNHSNVNENQIETNNYIIKREKI